MKLLTRPRVSQAQCSSLLPHCYRYKVPRIAYINKLDKPGASIANTLRSIQRKLSVEPLLTQMALGGEGKQFFGIVDLGLKGICFL